MNTLTLDFETFFADDYTLSKMTTEAYVRDPRFEVYGVGLKWNGDDAIWITQPDRKTFKDAVDWKQAVLCHHAAFDGLILSHHYGVYPGQWLDTYSMAQFLFGPDQPKSLGGLAKRFGLPEKTMPYDKVKGRPWSALPRETQREVADGCLRDVELTYQIFQRMMKGDY